jgi:uncharacterized protein (DUF362 family)
MRIDGEKSVVAIARVEGDVGAAVRAAMEAAEYRRFVPEGARVVVKPNLGFDLLIPGTVTAPSVLDAVLETVAREAASLTVVEADQVLEHVQGVFDRHYRPVAERHGVPFVNMTRPPVRRRRLEGARVFPEASLPTVLDGACLVTVPVMKTHDKTGLSGAIKNQWGCLPVARHNYHLLLDNALVDILRLTRPAFAVVDATMCLEGNGPKTGRPKAMDLVLASGDPVAIDAVQALLMGFGPDEVDHVRLTGEAGLGEHRLTAIEIRGPAIEGLRSAFARAGHNLVSKVELGLRRSAFRRLAFHTPLFDILVVGAKVWYHLWSAFGPRRRIWREALAHPVYGAQWRCAAKN